MNRRCALTLSGLLLILAPSAGAAELLADVVVYGATPAGCVAAVAAAREGASVILLAPDQHLGGMMTSGQCATDPGPFHEGALAGLAWEWHWRVENDYRRRGIDPGYRVQDRAGEEHWAWEPHVALRVTREMLDEAGVLLLAGRRLEAVALDGPRLLRLHTREGDFKGKVFIDATYEGDLAAMCGVRFLNGQEEVPPAEAGPDPAPDPENAEPPPAEPAGDTLPFLLCLTADVAAQVPLPRPAPSLDPLLLDDLRQWLASHPAAPPLWRAQPLPGGKLEMRFDLSGPLAGFFKSHAQWCELEAAARARLWEDQRQRVLALCRFLAIDPVVPEAWRHEWSALGLARDEFTGNAHWPPLLPLQTGRRMAGALVLSEAEALAGAGQEERIALCPFPLSNDTGHPAWPVPLRVLLPAMEECENLLVPAAPSCALAVADALRHESMLMTLGQSAGVAAALASQAEEVLPLHGLDHAVLRSRLSAQGVVLKAPALPSVKKESPPAQQPDDPATPDLVLDDRDAELKGPWRFSNHLQPHHGDGYQHDAHGEGGDCLAVFRFQVTETARYELWLAYTADRNRATNVPVIIETGGRKARLALDQTQPPPAGSAFRRLAELALQAGEPVTLTLSNKGADGHVVVDGLQLLKIDDAAATKP